MPYDIKPNYGGCSGYAVVGPDGDVKGCHSSRGQAQAQQRALYANEPESKVTKYRGELYAQLTPEEAAFHDALLNIVEEFGPFDQGTSSIWVGYEDGSDNEDASIGVKCSNCSFFNPENNGCAILSYAVDPNGKCRLAAIPDGYVNVGEDDEEMNDEDMDMDKASPCWDGYVQRGMKRGKNGKMVPNCVPVSKSECCPDSTEKFWGGLIDPRFAKNRTF